MSDFKKNEIYAATEVVRNFSSILSKVCNHEIKKAVIVKNNKFEAVLISIDEFERLEKAVDLLNIVYAKQRAADGN